MKGFRTIGFNAGTLAAAPWMADLLHQLGLVPEGQEVTAAVMSMAAANIVLRLLTTGPIGGNATIARWVTNMVLSELSRRRAEATSKVQAKQEHS